MADFLRDYWQRKPLLIRNAFPSVPAVTPEELAGYSLEEEVESRILVETPADDRSQSQWQQHLGPFDEQFFAQLPASHWTLLVQAVDQLHPQINQLLHLFRFLPNWRVDDIMASYATDGGNVGPHFDYYDVFLLQAQGTRLWRLGQRCDASSELRRDTDCKVLKHFHGETQWQVEPGDLLYIPPNIAHWGIAQGDCVTYSVGFRAPSHSEVLLDYTQELAAELSEDRRFSDAGRAPSAHAGEITPQDVARLRTILQQTLADDVHLRDWFGRYMTQPQRQSLQFEDEPKSAYRLTPPSRAAYFAESTSRAALFIDGEQFSCSLALAQQICDYAELELEVLATDERALIEDFIARGWVRA